jgi:hypothetical protein
MEMALFRHFHAVSARFLCQALLLQFCEKRLLQAVRERLTKAFPGANPRRGQERKAT